MSRVALLLALFPATLLLAADPPSPVRAADQPVKVGVIGLDNYQAVAFTQLWHDPKAGPDLKGLKVVAAYPGGSPDIEESVRELPKWTKGIEDYGVEVVKTPED